MSSAHYDLAVIGTGSGNTIVDERFADWRVAIVEEGKFGGTCTNVGCIPTKMFVYPADVVVAAADGPRLGIETASHGAHWSHIRDRIFGRIDAIEASGRAYRTERSPNVTVYDKHCRFVADRTLDTGTGETITAAQVVIAAGDRAIVPDVPGLADVPFHTSDTIMRIDDLPRRLAILGGGFIAAEFAHVFSAYGTQVTVVVRSERMLRGHDEDVSTAFTEQAKRQWDVRLCTSVEQVQRADDGISMQLSDSTTVEADLLLVATGRRSNGDLLDLSKAGVETDEGDVVLVDEFQRTSAPGVWALGDIANHLGLKHVANHEARVVQHNLLHPDDLIASSHHAVPYAVFTHPQVASVGLTEQEARVGHIPYVAATQQYADTAYGWAMEDTIGFAKLLADPDTGHILGGHFLGPQASNLVQPVVSAMAFGRTAHEFARGQYWIHPALMEVTENALLAVDGRARSGRSGQ